MKFYEVNWVRGVSWVVLNLIFDILTIYNLLCDWSDFFMSVFRESKGGSLCYLWRMSWSNSIWCTKCQKWVHRSCWHVLICVSLSSCQNVDISKISVRHQSSVKDKLELKKGDDILKEVETFCYLGDMFRL